MRTKKTSSTVEVGRYIYYSIQVYNKTFLSAVEGRVDRGRQEEDSTTFDLTKLTPVNSNILPDPVLQLMLHSFQAASPNTNWDCIVPVDSPVLETCMDKAGVSMESFSKPDETNCCPSGSVRILG